MNSKPFQILGVLALFAWTGLGLFAWMEVKSQLTITIEETSTGQSEEAALLAERLTTLSTDLDALTDALGGNFELVAQAIGTGADEQAVRSALIEQRLGSLERALPLALEARETAGALRTALAQVERLRSSITTDFQAKESEPTIVEAVPKITEARLVVPEVVPELVQPLAPTPVAVATKRSFLAFNLPSRDFQFEGPQSFEILSDLSRVGFDAKSTLHDFSGVSNQVSGNFRVDLAHPEEGIAGNVSIRTNSLLTGLEARDEAMLEHLGSELFPSIEFRFERFRTSTLDAEALELDGVISGKMTINGTTRDLEMKISAYVDESRRLVIEGEATLSREDYKVHVPGKLGLISTEDEVRIWINLRTRARVEASQ